MNLAATLRLNSAGFTGPLGMAQQAVGAFRGGLGRILLPLAGLSAAMMGVAAAKGVLDRALSESAQMEDFEVAFRTLLGSAEAARERMAALEDFAASTPFELPEITQASQLLQAFTGDALSTGEGLRLVGDSAAAVNRPLADVTMWVGRLYAGLRDGQPLGEPIQNLTQLGLISTEARKRLGEVAGQSLDAAATMGVLNEVFGKNAGAMARLAETYNGRLSTMRDAISAAYRALGEPIRDALKPWIESATARIESFRPRIKALGEDLALVLRGFSGAAAGGQLGNVLGLSLRYGFALALNFLSAGLVASVSGFGDAMALTVGNLGAIEDVLTGAAAQFGAALLNAIQTPLAYIQAFFEQLAATPWLAMAMGAGSATAAGSFGAQASGRAARILDEGGPTFGFGGQGMNAREISAAARAQMQEGLAALVEPLATGIESIFRQTRERGIDDISGAGGIRAELTSLITELATAGQTAKDAATAAAGGPAAAENGATGLSQVDPLKGDRLSRIGGFIGGAGGPAVDYARRTAAATEKIAEKIVQALRPSSFMTATPAIYS